ncbi:CvpA family protein, partial [Patescibacteria group bacterium]|nr:CvpA family protein [Patescibacteria group bacterium]MBU1629816.1 CvpA family protein [Patescibacteria group bacterium]MBU1908238.1 CvpA family protein [Patescibacteria group bacterium]
MIIASIIIILLLVGYIGAGYKDGLVQTLGRLIGAVAGFVLARSWSASIAFIFNYFLPEGWGNLAAFVAIFFIVNRLVGFLFHIIEGPLKILSFIPLIKNLNSLLGAAIGIFEGIVMLGGSIWILTTFKLLP